MYYSLNYIYFHIFKINMSSSSFNSVNDDAECKRIIAIKDYYELMKVDKSATQDEIRRAYKKVSVFLYLYLFS